MTKPASSLFRPSRRDLLRGLGAGAVLLAPFARSRRLDAAPGADGNLLVFFTPNGFARDVCVRRGDVFSPQPIESFRPRRLHGPCRLPAIDPQPTTALAPRTSLNSTSNPRGVLLSLSERRNRASELGMALTKISPLKNGKPPSCRHLRVCLKKRSAGE